MEEEIQAEVERRKTARKTQRYSILRASVHLGGAFWLSVPYLTAFTI